MILFIYIAIAQPRHRKNIHANVQDIINMIDNMYDKCLLLIDSSSQSQSRTISRTSSPDQGFDRHKSKYCCDLLFIVKLASI